MEIPTEPVAIITSKVDFIDIVLGSYFDFPGNEEERQKALINELSLISDADLKKKLKSYIRMKENELMDERKVRLLV